VIVVVPALLAQVLLPVSRQSPFPPWVFVARALLLLLPLPLFFARTLWQFSWMQETSMSSEFVESARNRARFLSV
jgi:hypothetical protein